MSETNWNVELRKIEREFSGLPKEPSQAEINARRASERLAKQRQDAVNATIGASARLSLVAVLATAVSFWPYARECGFGLFAFLASEGLILAGAFWVFTYTWRFHLAKLHGLALAMVLGALALISLQVLPRVGYAKVDTAHPQQWTCAAPAPTP